jgi:hypothetical protein
MIISLTHNRMDSHTWEACRSSSIDKRFLSPLATWGSSTLSVSLSQAESHSCVTLTKYVSSGLRIFLIVSGSSQNSRGKPIFASTYRKHRNTHFTTGSSCNKLFGLFTCYHLLLHAFNQNWHPDT